MSTQVDDHGIALEHMEAHTSRYFMKEAKGYIMAGLGWFLPAQFVLLLKTPDPRAGARVGVRYSAYEKVMRSIGLVLSVPRFRDTFHCAFDENKRHILFPTFYMDGFNLWRRGLVQFIVSLANAGGRSQSQETNMIVGIVEGGEKDDGASPTSDILDDVEHAHDRLVSESRGAGSRVLLFDPSNWRGPDGKSTHGKPLVLWIVAPLGLLVRCDGKCASLLMHVAQGSAASAIHGGLGIDLVKTDPLKPEAVFYNKGERPSPADGYCWTDWDEVDEVLVPAVGARVEADAFSIELQRNVDFRMIVFYVESSTRPIDRSKNQPIARRFDRDREVWPHDVVTYHRYEL
jgi:hypothetical protein